MTPELKKIAVFATVLGVTIVLTGMSALWVTSRPKGWDSNSIKCTKLTMTQAFKVLPADQKTGDKLRLEYPGFDVEFILENHTRSDYTVPVNLKLFARDERSAALRELKVTFDHSFVIPAKERAEVDASIDYFCGYHEVGTNETTGRRGQDCFNDAFGHVAEVVGFDYATHTRLDLPRPKFSDDSAAAAALGR